MNSCSVFVTGNANKLREVKHILSQGAMPIDLDSKELDSKFLYKLHALVLTLYVSPIQSVPEVQGSTAEVAIAKCRQAAEMVCMEIGR